MSRSTALAAFSALAAAALCETGVADETEPDALTGLVMAGDWQLVRGNCVACHSARLITQQRGDAQYWRGLIRWMQAEQNLWDFEPDIEERIVAYLAENYALEEAWRRAPLPRHLLPDTGDEK